MTKIKKARPKVVGWWAVEVTPQQDLIKFGQDGDTVRPYKTAEEAMDQIEYLKENELDDKCRYYMLKVFNNGQMVTYEQD